MPCYLLNGPIDFISQHSSTPPSSLSASARRVQRKPHRKDKEHRELKEKTCSYGNTFTIKWSAQCKRNEAEANLPFQYCSSTWLDKHGRTPPSKEFFLSFQECRAEALGNFLRMIRTKRSHTRRRLLNSNQSTARTRSDLSHTQLIQVPDYSSKTARCSHLQPCIIYSFNPSHTRIQLHA